ncbi:MAG: NAD-dependent epimerase/dehydratase family protein [Cohaesibacter sp.]|jgi:nucleoside-diphosphate-sugar epimerase|nr:NAD-dependent epimerase/dehydratase family protein [Cohaesibacter sp.]
MRIFVTGGTGLVGSAAIKALLEVDHSVTALARSEQSASKIEALGAKALMGDLKNPENWADEALSHDSIIHAAATFEEDMGAVDQDMVQCLTQKAKSLPKEHKINVIYTGGCWLYPESPVIPLTERHVLDPLPAFEWMLDSIEQLHACPAFHLTVIHPGFVVGQKEGMICKMMEELRQDKQMTIIGSTDIHYPFIHSSDLGDLYRRAVEHGGDGLLLNASGFKSASLGEIAQKIAAATGLPHMLKIVTIDEMIAEHGSWAAGFGRSQRMEADRARDSLGWEAKFDDIDKIIADCL